MRRFSHIFTVDVDIDRVWAFYTNISHLEVITPPEMKLHVLKTTTGKQLVEGTEVWITGKLVIKSNWHSKIMQMQSYAYVDEMLSGRFKMWKHVHVFKKAGSGTEIIDEIDFELPYGVVGKMFEGYVYRKLKKVFEHRKQATIAALR